MVTYDSNCWLVSELFLLLRHKAKVEKTRKIDELLAKEISEKSEETCGSLLIVRANCMTPSLEKLIKCGLAKNKITKIPNGTITLKDYIELLGISKSDAISSLSSNSYVVSKIETRGKKPIGGFPNYRAEETLIIPPPPLHLAIISRKTLHHIATLNVGELLNPDIASEVYGDKKTPSLFDEVVEMKVASKKIILGTW